MKKFVPYLFFGLGILVFASCSKESSKTTGWEFNSEDWGGFEKVDFKEQETGPNLVYIKGGSFTMGQTEKDLMYSMNSLPRKVTVSSFYIDETEVANIDYREYLWWLSRVFENRNVYRDALPDTFSWREELGKNEQFVKYYFRHPAYRNYPVVGVNWVQAKNYAKWRTDRVNEMILIREGFIEPNPEQTAPDVFTTEAYLAGKYQPVVKNKKESYKPGQGGRQVKMKDGILLPDYRLPTEAEWEYAALALVGDATNANVNTRRLYSWEGLSLRKQQGKYRGKFRVNFQRGSGDYMGIASGLNDASEITAPVRSYWPNDYGLYHMSGNVSEWVSDVYRPLSFEDMQDFNPHRGNVFKKKKRTEDGLLPPKDSSGRFPKEEVTIEENTDRRNYQKADVRGHKDPMEAQGGEQMYDYGVSTLVQNEARVYKGGSWNDRAYWMSPGTRRKLDQQQSKSSIGFRCAMTRVGPSNKEATKKE